VDNYNLSSKDKTFDVGEQVLVLQPDSTNKLKSSWQGPGIIHTKVSDNSYTVAMPDNAIKHLHANHLRTYNVGVNGIGVIFESDEEKMGRIVPCETGVSGNVMLQTELTQEMIDGLEIDKLSKEQYSELKSLLFKFKYVFND